MTCPNYDKKISGKGWYGIKCRKVKSMGKRECWSKGTRDKAVDQVCSGNYEQCPIYCGVSKPKKV